MWLWDSFPGEMMAVREDGSQEGSSNQKFYDRQSVESADIGYACSLWMLFLKQQMILWDYTVMAHPVS